MIQLFDVGVIRRVRQHRGDDPALLGDLEALFIYRASQASMVRRRSSQ